MTKQLEALIARKGCAVTGNYYLAECGNCGEMFTSERMTGGEPIADTGDYGDCYCPHCDTDDSDIIDCGTANSSAAEAWNYQQKHIDALIAALEQSDGQRESWRQVALNNISEREKDIAALDAARKRIAELEARPVAVKLPPEINPGQARSLFSIEIDEDQAGAAADGWNSCLKAIRAAGGQMEGE
ncbi:hypothetical protein JT31_21775 [Cedecea neteri]|uniref:Ead/Ea22-like family protein n=1 Tax=Cedecea neteri TaxID=158822 RepID=A0A089Q9G7_9ENTR|nr:hypothetical protein [Cedecea neteri]AIR07144.1 hypothetical protein JT31_21775 [Cedecea neteri]